MKTFMAIVPASVALLTLVGGQANGEERSPEQQEAIKAIEEAGGSVREIAQNDKRLEVDFHLASDSVSDDAVAAVAKLKDVVRLHLGNLDNAPLVMGALGRSRELALLEALHLENSKISDADLENLKGLKNLEYLNLYGTEVGDAGLAHLKGLTNLKKLYVWQTKATEQGIAELKKALPDLDVNTGWELKEAETEKKEPAKDSK